MDGHKTFVLSWIYKLIVKSQILNNFVWFLGPLSLQYIKMRFRPDMSTDDAGCTMNVTRWNGRPMAAFGPHNYSRIKGLTIRNDDVIICGFPKTGCHWMYEILYMLVKKKNSVSKNGKLFEGMMEAMPEILLDSVPSPRVLNTHVYFDELPKGVKKNRNKIILTIRCPKDVVVSYYNHTRNLPKFYGYNGTFENYFKLFTSGQVDYGCYFDFYRSWQKAMKSMQNQQQIYFVSFEDLKADPVKKIKEMAEFLGHPVSEEFAEKVANDTSFSRLKGKREDNPLFRKGIVGDWKNWLTEEQAEEVDTLWREKMDGFEMPPGSTTVYCADKE